MLRSIKRNIARNRMKDMGIDHINHKMAHRQNDTLIKNTVQALQKTRNGRRRLIAIYAKNPPIWKRIIEGDLKKTADKSWNQASIKRGRAWWVSATGDGKKPKKGGSQRRLTKVS